MPQIYADRRGLLPEEILDLFEQGIVEIVRDGEFALGGAKLPAFLCCRFYPHELGDRLSGIRDDDLVADCHVL